MKIDVRYIIKDHFRTLRNAEDGRTSVFDVFLFYVMPVLTACLSYQQGFVFNKAEVYSVSITFFGIFIALLLNLQVAIFSILQRRWESAEDDRMQPHQARKFQVRGSLLAEVNANISYLILVCCVALFAALIFYVGEWNSGFGPATTILLYMHFLLTLIMIVKRSHVLFQSEYGEHTGR
jgi:hypothetical protein